MPLSDSSSQPSRSPSLTSSVDSAKSFSIPSPKGSETVITPPESKSKYPSTHSHFNQPSTRRMDTLDISTHPHYFSTSPPSSPPNKPPNQQDTLPWSRSPTQRYRSPMQRYRPYIPKERGIVPPALHYAAQSLGIMSPSNVTLDEVEERRDTFIEALSVIPDSVLLSALEAKRADHKCVSLRLALARAEIQSSEQRMSFLSTMYDQHVGAHAISEACLGVFDQVLGSRGLEDVEDSKRFYMDTYREALAAVAISEGHMAQVQDALGPRVSRWFGGGGDRNDPFRRYNEDSFDRSSDSEETSSDEIHDEPLPSVSTAPCV